MEVTACILGEANKDRFPLLVVIYPEVRMSLSLNRHQALALLASLDLALKKFPAAEELKSAAMLQPSSPLPSGD